jgi:hypothetical protein
MRHADPQHYPEEIRECWAVHQALRSLGFSPDDIYVALGADARNPEFAAALFVVLKAQGKEFIVTLAGYESEERAEAMLGKWTEFVTLWKDEVFDDDVMGRIYEKSNVIQNKVEFVIALHNKGIRPTEEWS